MTSIPDYVPTDPQGRIWDVVVIGTGAGGATAGFNLARLGRSVLFLERGKLSFAEPASTNAVAGRQASDGAPHGWWPDRITRSPANGGGEWLALGCGTGGSTALFSMVMDRFRTNDFTPRRYCPEPQATTLPDAWPVSLSELEPYYARAEALFGVRGTEDPLYPAGNRLRTPVPSSDADTLVYDTLLRSGLHPFRLHYAREHVDGCTGCYLSLCARSCRNDAGRICVLPALREHAAHILPECHVVRLEADGARRVRSAIATWNGRRIRIEARVFVLALSAILTPALLLRSHGASSPDGLGNSSGMIGRNLMTHVSDALLVRVDDSRGCINSVMNNGVSINDFYVHEGVKLGNVHAHAVHFPEAAGAQGSVLFSTIVEDFPYFRNRVVPAPGSETDVIYEYHYPQELRLRAYELRAAFVSALRKTARSITVLRPEGRLNGGHMCGTCRFGDDPRASVLDRNNRMHDLDNVYVVDGSFFPSSGGMNPSLTIVANSLRVSDLIARG